MGLAELIKLPGGQKWHEPWGFHLADFNNSTVH